MGKLFVNGQPLETRQTRRYTKEYLDTLDFKSLKKVGAEFNVTDRSSKKLIEEILAAQEMQSESFRKDQAKSHSSIDKKGRGNKSRKG